MECYRRLSARPSWACWRLGIREHGVSDTFPRITLWHSISADPVRGSGLGLLEYLQFFEDVGMEPIMAVWSGEYIFRQNTISSLSLRMRLAGRTRLRARRN